MIAILRTSSLLVALSILSGCTLFKVITFQSAETSFQREDSEASLKFIAKGEGKTCLDTLIPKPAKEEKFEGFIPPVIVGAIAGVALNMAASEIEGYLAGKQKEFKASYNASKNLPSFYLKSNHFKPNGYNCLGLWRTVKRAGQSEREAAFEWIAVLSPNDSGTALQIKTESIMLRFAAARTGSKSRKVDVTVEVKIDATTLNDKGDTVTTTIADKVLAYPGLTIPESIEALATPTASSVESSWFPAIPLSQKEIEKCNALHANCAGASPVNVSVLVTETGSGGDDIGDLGKEIGDNKKTLSDAVSKAITDALTPKASSGSSK